MAYSFRNPSDGIIKHYLETSKIIAVVGLSDREDRRCKSGAIGLFLSTLVQPVAKSLEKGCTLACRKFLSQ